MAILDKYKKGLEIIQREVKSREIKCSFCHQPITKIEHIQSTVFTRAERISFSIASVYFTGEFLFFDVNYLCNDICYEKWDAEVIYHKM